MSKKVTVSAVQHPRYKYRVRFAEGETGDTKSKWFKKKLEAEKFATEKRKDLEKRGLAQKEITEQERRAVHRFREAVQLLPGEASKASITDAVEFYLKHAQARNKSIECRDIADSMLQRLKAEGRSKRHTDSLTSRLRPFLSTYGDWLACDVSTEIVDEYLTHDCMKLAAQTRVHRRRALYQLFQQALQLKAATENPVADSINPKVTSDDPGILSPNELAQMLFHAGHDVVAGLAISFFAGVRRAEIERLDWKDIDFDDETIEIKAKNAKSAQRRFIPMSDNLKAWLAPHAKLCGLVVESGYVYRKGIKTAQERAGIAEWPHNAGRHSFASYHLALHGESGKLAIALGHPDPRLTFSRYRKLVKKKAAESYWAIIPNSENEIIRIQA